MEYAHVKEKNMNQLRKSRIGIVFVAAIALIIFGCGNDGGAAGGGESTTGSETSSSNEEEQEKVIKVGLVNWADAIAMTNIARVVLEEEYGYTVETVTADVGVVYSSIARGDYDLYLDMWLPTTHAAYKEEYGDDLVLLSPTYEGARIGLVVPEYVEIDSITELNANADRFGERIVGIDTGAGIMQTTNRAIEEYDLDMDLIASSGPAMTTALADAIENDAWVAVTGWRPHWKFARWDLKFLEDPQGLYGETETTYAVGHTEFTSEFPEVTAFLENFLLTDAQLGGVMGLIAESDEEPYQVAKAWIADNQDLVDEWTAGTM